MKALIKSCKKHQMSIWGIKIDGLFLICNLFLICEMVQQNIQPIILRSFLQNSTNSRVICLFYICFLKYNRTEVALNKSGLSL